MEVDYLGKTLHSLVSILECDDVDEWSTQVKDFEDTMYELLDEGDSICKNHGDTYAYRQECQKALDLIDAIDLSKKIIKLSQMSAGYFMRRSVVEDCLSKLTQIDRDLDKEY